MLGCFKAAGRPDQRELPLRGRGAALPLRQRRSRRADLRGRVRAARRLGASRGAEAAASRAARRRHRHRHRGSRRGRVRARARRSPSRPATGLLPRSPDDLYVLYTGGTTGMPKGVMWRAEDIFFAAMGGGNYGGPGIEQPDDIVEEHERDPGVSFALAPLMHGNAQWSMFVALFGGNTVTLNASRQVRRRRDLGPRRARGRERHLARRRRDGAAARRRARAPDRAAVALRARVRRRDPLARDQAGAERPRTRTSRSSTRSARRRRARTARST